MNQHPTVSPAPRRPPHSSVLEGRGAPPPGRLWGLAAAILLTLPLCLTAQSDETSRARNQPVEPLRLIDNLYYVGASDIASYLITTPEGHIVIDGGFVETAPMIRANIEALGFDPKDVKLLLNSHAHFDHAGGLAALAEWTGAEVVASRADAPLIASGGDGDYFLSAADNAFPAVEVARRVDDGEEVHLGGTTLVAHLTAGHTRGCTSWSLQVDDGGTPRTAVVVCSVTLLPGVQLLDNDAYPNIVDDFRATSKRLEALPCDIFLAAHASFFDLAGKRQRVTTSTQNPFIDPQGYHDYLARNRKHFENELAAQLAAVEAEAAGSDQL